MPGDSRRLRVILYGRDFENPVKRNYQYEYARKQMGKNKYAYYDNHRAVKKNIAELSRILKHALALRSQSQSELSDRGKLLPARLWKVGRTQDARLFAREQKAEETEFVVDVLIDASGSQRKRRNRWCCRPIFLWRH